MRKRVGGSNPSTGSLIISKSSAISRLQQCWRLIVCIQGGGLIALIGEEKLINKQADCGIVDRH